MTGIFRYVVWRDVADRMEQGWRYCGVAHEEWSAIMWWCVGDCEDGEAP